MKQLEKMIQVGVYSLVIVMLMKSGVANAGLGKTTCRSSELGSISYSARIVVDWNVPAGTSVYGNLMLQRIDPSGTEFLFEKSIDLKAMNKDYSKIVITDSETAGKEIQMTLHSIKIPSNNYSGVLTIPSLQIEIPVNCH